MPEVSVILPCYNAGQFVRRALESVREQTYRDFEIVVINDGSTDVETCEILKELGPDVRVIHQENRGLPGARNTGYREALGRYVLPLDCDDYLEPTYLEQAMELMDGRETRFVFSHLNLVGEKSGILQKNYNKFEQLFTNQLPYCMLVPKSLWKSVGGYDETMRKGFEDWEFNIKLGLNGADAKVIEEPLFNYYVSGQGMLVSISRKAHAELWRAIQQRHADAYTFSALLRSWKEWRLSPSTHSLWVYFVMIGVFKILPEKVWNRLFSLMTRFSHSNRLKGHGKGHLCS